MAKPEKPAKTSEPIHDLIRDRWSPRAFADRPVPVDALRSVLEAGRWAASSNNGQPWRFIVAAKADPDAFAVAVSGFNEGNQRWVVNAPVLMFLCARKTFEANGNPNLTSWYDTGAAATTLSLQATALGLVVHQCAGIQRDTIRDCYGVPEEFEVCTGLALGYQGDDGSLPDDLADRERQARVRKPLGEIVFERQFGQAAALNSK